MVFSMDHLGSHRFCQSLSLPSRRMTGLWGGFLNQEHAAVLGTTIQALHHLPSPLLGLSEHQCPCQVFASQNLTRNLDSDPGQSALSLISNIMLWRSIEFHPMVVRHTCEAMHPCIGTFMSQYMCSQIVPGGILTLGDATL